MPTEAVSIVIGADFTGAQAFAQANQATASLNPSIKEYATNAQLAGKAGRYLASSLGGGVFAQAAGELSQAAGMAKQLAGQLEMGGKYALLLKAGIYGIVAVAGVKLGTALYDVVHNTTRAANEAARFADELARGEAHVRAMAKSDLGKQADLVGLMPEPDQGAAYAEIIDKLQAQEADAIEETKRLEQALHELDTTWNRTFNSDLIAAATKDLDTQQAYADSLRDSWHDIADKTGEYAEKLKTAKADAAQRKAVEEIIKGLEKESDQLAYNKRDYLELQLIQNNATDAQRKAAFTAFDSAAALTLETASRKKAGEALKDYIDEIQVKNTELREGKEAAEEHKLQIAGVSKELIEQQRALVAENIELEKQAKIKKDLETTLKQNAAAEKDYADAIAIKNTELREGKSAAAEHKAALDGVSQAVIDANKLMVDQNEKLTEAAAFKKNQDEANKKYLQDVLVKNTELREGKSAADELRAINDGASKDFVQQQRSIVAQSLELEKKQEAKKKADAKAKSDGGKADRLLATEGRFLTQRRDTNAEASREVANNTSRLLAMIPSLRTLNASAATIANNTRNQIGLVP